MTKQNEDKLHKIVRIEMSQNKILEDTKKISLYKITKNFISYKLRKKALIYSTWIQLKNELPILYIVDEIFKDCILKIYNIEEEEKRNIRRMLVCVSKDKHFDPISLITAEKIFWQRYDFHKISLQTVNSIHKYLCNEHEINN